MRLKIRWFGIILVVMSIFTASGASAASGDIVSDFYAYTTPDRTEFRESPVSDTSGYYVTHVTFPSPVTSPSANNNLVRGYYYRPKVKGPLPAVVVLHGFGGFVSAKLAQGICTSLAQHKMAAFLLELPYHMERRAEGKIGGHGFIASDPRRLVESGRQSVLDVRCALDWLATRPEVDPNRLGVAGISLGAIIAELAMGVDDRLTAGVTIIGGGDLTGILWRSPLTLPWKLQMKQAGITESALRETIRPAEPLALAERNRPRRVLMINGYYDVIIPESCTLKLWEALDRPTIIWMNSGHFSIVLAWKKIEQATCDYMQGVFGLGPEWKPRSVSVQPVKLALLWDERQGLRPGVFKELVCSGGRGRLSLDLGLTTKGIFAGARGMVTENVSVGVGIPVGKGQQDLEFYTALELVL